MAKIMKIRFADERGEGKEYTLEFTRRSVERLEEQGFRIADISEKPVTALPMLFAGAFYAHHPTVKQSTVDAIFSGIRNKEDFLAKLAEMYYEPLESLMDEPNSEEDAKNAAEWEASW